MSDVIMSIYLGILGLCMGSFANAAVWRLKVKKDIIKDRSECVHCKHKLSPADLVPVFSWLALKGKCRYCKKPISAQYPLVELAVGAYFVVSYLFWPTPLTEWQQWAQFGLWLIYGVMLAVLFVYDLRWFLLPDRIVKPLIALGAVSAALRLAGTPGLTITGAIVDIALSLGVIGGLYGALYAVSKGKWVGFGDVKLGLFMGLVLGWQAGLVCLFVANLIGCFVLLPGLLTKKLSRTSKVPFGPFLIAGFIFAGLWGVQLWNWYLYSLPTMQLFV